MIRIIVAKIGAKCKLLLSQKRKSAKKLTGQDVILPRRQFVKEGLDFAAASFENRLAR
jgi:hypothetical protein